MLFPKFETGFNLIDNLWAGFFKGRIYLITGPVNSGKTTFCLQFASKGIASKEKVVFFTDERTEDVLLRSEGLQFDLSSSLELGDFLIFNLGNKRVSPSDSLLHQTIIEVLQIIEKEKPTRLIFDQFTPFLQFENQEVLKSEIAELVDSLEKFKVTTVITVGEPASEPAEKILEFLSSLATATLKLSVANLEEKRTITLNARLGHYPSSYSASFVIQPKIGLTELIIPPAPPPASGIPKESIRPTGESTIAPETVESPESQPTEKIETPVIEKEVPVESAPASAKAVTTPREQVEAKPDQAISKATPIDLDTKISDIPKSIVIGENIPEYPTRDLERDDLTGLYNFDGLLNIISKAIEKNNKFSLMIVRMVKGVDSRAKRLLLSQNLASAIKGALNRPVPVGRYSDKIIVFLHRANKSESENMAQAVETKALATLTAQNETLKTLEIKTDVYTYPDDIHRIEQVEAIVQAGEAE
jgi:archaellum biogenesis ATPase FlaH